MRNVTAIGILFLMAFTLPTRKTKVYLIGDSTMANKEIKAYPETGWGMPFKYFFDSTVDVDNRAKNGRSTQSFIDEGLWKPVVDNLNEGDYVFVQFGHNDEVPTKKTATTPEQFRNNLKKFVNETREKKAIPVLLTSMARRKFDSTGKIIGTHDEYMKITRAVAAEEKVVLFDMDIITQQLYQQFGAENSALLFLQLKSGEHPNHPKGKDDNTHFNEFGARLVAQLVLKEIRSQLPELATRIVNSKE